MDKRELGKSGEKIPVIGMGTWEIGDVQDEGCALEIQAIRKGIGLGMALIDTAETSTLEHVNQNAAPIRERISGDDYKTVSRKFE
jgi:diketogulonate reductase-like aldo/keto reductase